MEQNHFEQYLVDCFSDLESIGSQKNVGRLVPAPGTPGEG